MNTMYTILNGNIDVPDGKIDTSHFAYPHHDESPSSGGRIPHGVKYGIDLTYRELYQPIEEHVDTRFIELVDEWFREEVIIRGYRRNK